MTLSSLKNVHLAQCESFLESKMTKQSSNAKGTIVIQSLKLVHTNVCGLMNVSMRYGYNYYIIFIDIYSKFGYVYLVHHKSETFKIFQEFSMKVAKQLGLPIKTSRFGRRVEYLLDKFIGYLRENEILSQLIVRDTQTTKWCGSEKEQNLT